MKAGTSRPVKVLFHSAKAAVKVFRSSSGLKETRYNRVYITPDRTPEERVEKRKLVTGMKEKIRSELQQYHYTKNGAFQSKEKVSTAPPDPSRCSCALSRVCFCFGDTCFKPPLHKSAILGREPAY